jgi:hypothetical protein
MLALFGRVPGLWKSPVIRPLFLIHGVGHAR